MNRTHLPPTQYPARRSTLREESLVRPNWQFVKVAENKSVGNVLEAESLLTMQVVRVLHAATAREARKRGQRAVSVGQRFGPGVGSQQCESSTEAALRFYQQAVVA